MSSIDIVGIGDHQIEYPKFKNEDFETTEEYLTIAKKVIRHFAPRYRAGLAEEMLMSEDAISNVATAIMLADWRWTPEYRSPSGKVRTKHCYRNQCGKWAVLGYIERQQLNSKNVLISLDDSLVFQNGLHELLPDPSQEAPDEAIVKQEHETFVNSKINSMLGSGLLTEQQAGFIKSHFIEGETLQKIGEANKISREAVRQTIKRGMTNLRREMVHEY